MKIKIFLLFVFFILFSNIFSQDTVSVYFEFNKFKLSDSEITKIKKLYSDYIIHKIDSVKIIGMTDSIGSEIHNKKLALKRANQVFKYCEFVHEFDVPYEIKSIGISTSEKQIDKNRKVEILIYYQNISKEFEDVKLNDNTLNCYKVSYELMRNSNIYSSKKGGKAITYIETENEKLITDKLYYYGRKNNQGILSYYKLNWKKKSKGKKGWKTTVFYTTIPLKDFNNFKIFTIYESPCDSCSSINDLNINNENVDSSLYIDVFLKEKIEFKQKIFNPNKFVIRAPKEFVQIDDEYYFGCNFDHKVEWKSKKGNRNKDYYFTEIKTSKSYLDYITRKKYYCKYENIETDCDYKIGIINCKFKGFYKKQNIIFEMGNNIYNTHQPYIALGLNYYFHSFEAKILSGIDNNFLLYSSFTLKYHFLEFPFRIFLDKYRWQKPSNTYKNFIPYCTFYIGTEYKTLTDENLIRIYENNIHLGFSFQTYTRLLDDLFIHYGIGYNHIDKKTENILQFGIVLKLFQVNILNNN